MVLIGPTFIAVIGAAVLCIDGKVDSFAPHARVRIVNVQPVTLVNLPGVQATRAVPQFQALRVAVVLVLHILDFLLVVGP